MHPYKSPDSLGAHVIRVAAPPDDHQTGGRPSVQTEFSIAELAQEFGLTLRALRFYDSRGLLSPRRAGRQRIFSEADRERLALIVKGKKLGFTLTEISQMVEVQSGRASAHTLKLTAETCEEQIAFFERQIREATEAIAELRQMQSSLGKKGAERDPKA